MHRLLSTSFSSLGGEMKSLLIPPRQTIDPEGKIIQQSHGEALQITKRLHAPIRLFFGGHMDTVFRSDDPFQQAKIQSSRLIGPGVADMKGGLLVMLKALETLEKSPWAEKIGWEILITPDEEAGSCGSELLYASAAKKYDAGFIFEPAFANGNLVKSRKGSANIALTVQGKSAHVGRDFYAGKNAVAALARFLTNLEQINDPSRGITVNIGEFQGGSAFNIVPDFAFAKVNMRVDQLDDEKITQECLQLLQEEANAQEGIQLNVHPLAVRAPKIVDQPTERLFELVQACGTELGLSLDWQSTGGVCDGNILAAGGLPTLDTMGVVGGQLHTADEYMEIDSLADRTCLTALMLLKIAKGDISLPEKEGTP